MVTIVEKDHILVTVKKVVAEVEVSTVQKLAERAKTLVVESNCPEIWLAGDLLSGVLF